MSRILILRTDHLGDAILTTPLIRSLAKAGHAVELVLPDAWLPLFSGNPHLAALHGLQAVAGDWKRHWLRLARWIRSGRYDVLILPHARPWQLPLVSLFSGVSCRVAMWGGVWGRLTFHHCLRSGILDRPRPYADILLDCARLLGAPPQGLESEIYPQSPPLETPHRIALHPGSGGNACNFGPMDYQTLARWFLDETDWDIVLTGTDSEKNLLAEWDPKLLTHPRLSNQVGALSLEEMARLLPTLALFISPSTGPLHMAASLGVPTLTPFCSRPDVSPRVWGNPRPNGFSMEAPSGACQAVPAGSHCRFAGKIDLRDFFEAALRAASRTPGAAC
ncbi:MAG: glycosyltransferase family 9 protein [Verrucomicrobium sp.]|nr:glycosyltransferase family 9 protein [Verrucomicrobium sp.]